MERTMIMAKRIEILTRYEAGGLSCLKAAVILGISERHFRRLRDGYSEEGAAYLIDKRVGKASPRRAEIEELERILKLYREEYFGWNVQHFYDYLKKDEGFTRSYTWVKDQLQAHHLKPKGKAKGQHRKKRERKPMRGMMLFQDGSTHEWLIGEHPLDLIVTLDDATSDIYSMFFVAQEGTHSTLKGLYETILAKGLFGSFYTDRGSHYFNTPQVGGKVDKINVTQVGRALKQLGIAHIPSYSPEARGRMERVFKTLQERLPKDLQKAGITDVNDANEWLKKTYIKRHNARFATEPLEKEVAFIPFIGDLNEVLCVEEARTVRNDNCVSFNRKILQIPADKHRHHYVKCEVKVRQYLDKSFGVFHGQRSLARFKPCGELIKERPVEKQGELKDAA